MGACDFITYMSGENASKAFEAAGEGAFWEYGHGGYTGTIAEKEGFIDFTSQVPADKRLEVISAISNTFVPEYLPAIDGVSPALLREILKAYGDKWGPAVCLQVGECATEGKTLAEFVFLGIAST